MAASGLHRLPVQMLGDLVSPRALERILQDAAGARGTTPAQLDAAALEDILKREVFKRLQLSVPAPLAKRRVSEVLDELLKTSQERPAASTVEHSLLPLEDSARRFSLYFDWPETQRLRGILSVARQEEEEGRDIGALVQEGQELVAQMDRRLQEGLVAQAQDLAELRAALTRVQGMGGREVRRLDALVVQIDEAQQQGTLLPGEVERARTLTYGLRKLLESSVVQGMPGNPSLDPEAQARVLALEQEHIQGVLNALDREFASLLQARADLRDRQAGLRGEAAAGQLTTDAVESWRESLRMVRDTVLTEQRAQLTSLEQQLAGLDAGADVRVALDAARHLLDGGNLANDELHELRGTLDALKRGEGGLGLQRELREIERSARDIPGAAAELAPLLDWAQTQLAAGAAVDLDTLWAVLERRRGAAAQERESFDARADRVVAEYDAVRDLAGETIQRLGRLADTLRAQRRLGTMSRAAQERYAQTLSDAEALLTEAQAEHRAAQEVTASFGNEALNGLLDVFELGGEAEGAWPAAPQTIAGTGVQTWTLQGGQLSGGEQEPLPAPLLQLIALAGDLNLTELTLSGPGERWEARHAAGRWEITRSPR
ncbi:hypothetical protein [Deinococcus aerophilus]|uniref:Chromosome segregation protein SMC n=1 Tax=Deinococcus aerophilus TaxID=522488 RepID=A0ABQ2GTU5_9DEIO|nr:hypothetical protein [Deinococcus aerophilus]GGM11316.1 hypothetical protein GCM10010841_19840 [Deinococcus aerophilus]